jgi:quercetin dioxygenase-like cupin family protein
MTEKIETGVHVWHSYWGALLDDGDSKNNSVIYGFENISSEHQHLSQAMIPDTGTCFGFIAEGRANVEDKQINWWLNAGQWFSLPHGLLLNLLSNSRVVISQSVGYQGVYAMGGPIEVQGRLRYIDGCSDTLLCAPPLLGDPCLNHLHFPTGIEQTAHTHPSTRAGIIAKGQGVCVISDGTAINLTVGDLFYIARNTVHHFVTTDSSMDVIAYHPDSDWGPTHDEHPMINRTWVDGQKIDNQAPQHQNAEIIRGR